MQRANRAVVPLRIDTRAGSIAEQVFHALRSSIVTMQLTPATALSEQDIAGRLNVSRQPVREAFIKLSEIGLVRQDFRQDRDRRAFRARGGGMRDRAARQRGNRRGRDG